MKKKIIAIIRILFSDSFLVVTESRGAVVVSGAMAPEHIREVISVMTKELDKKQTSKSSA